MLFNYKVVTKPGEAQEGSIEAINVDVAIASLQRRELVIFQAIYSGNVGMTEKTDLSVF